MEGEKQDQIFWTLLHRRPAQYSVSECIVAALHMQSEANCYWTVYKHTVLNGLMRYYGYDAKRLCRLEANNLLKVKATYHLHWASWVALHVASRMSSKEPGASGRLQVLVATQKKKKEEISLLSSWLPLLLWFFLHRFFIIAFSFQCGEVHAKQHDYYKCQKCAEEQPIKI